MFCKQAKQMQKNFQLRPKKAKRTDDNGFFEPIFFILFSAAEFTFVLFISVAKNQKFYFDCFFADFLCVGRADLGGFIAFFGVD
jgi:hypothetical protein